MAGTDRAKTLAAKPEDSEPSEQEKQADHAAQRKRWLPLSLGALGIVYGDIGTSPIYALREAYLGHGAVAANAANLLGILSLILWSLILVISGKYLLYVMRASNNGEGGIIALVALLNPWHASPGSSRHVLMITGLFGACLLYGDGTITPAISVLSAIEGLETVTPAFEPYVVPITVGILIALFLLQSRGTGGIGKLFGPVMLIWFATLAALGIGGIVQAPQVLTAVNPLLGVEFLLTHQLAGFLVLGTIFLVVTGGEALYADMGHFGINPIRIAWFGLVLPALVLNYFGQGAALLANPDIKQPFYELAPNWAMIPLVVLATIATIIASQAVISGVFSLTRQAVQLGQLPRMNIVQTSRKEYGQIYIPTVNWMLMIATIALVVGFGSSSNLAAAYGVAVATDMVITTILAFFVARRFNWHPLAAALMTVLFLTIDLAFAGANYFKIPDGGWYPLVIAALLFIVMSTWRGGRNLLKMRLHQDTAPIEDFIAHVEQESPRRLRGTAVFMTANKPQTPPMLYRHLEHHEVLHKQVVLLTILTEDVPRVPASERLQIEEYGQGFYRVIASYGFMQTVNVPVVLKFCGEFGLDINPDNVTYYVGRETLIPSADVPGMMLWREKLFAYLSRNSARATAFYAIPHERVVELGIQVEL